MHDHKAFNVTIRIRDMRHTFLTTPVNARRGERCIRFALIVIASLFTRSVSAQRSGNNADRFEHEIRPALVKYCFKCHGAKKQEAGLRLDSRKALFKGSDSGRVVVAGKPESSRLMRVLSHAGEVKMPPDRKLKMATRDAFALWIKAGVTWPNSPDGKSAKTDAELLKSHWAFQPIRRPPIPRVDDEGWSRTPVDAFILKKLRKAGLTPSQAADKRTLLRRVTFDLTGLPPTSEQAARYFEDKSPGAYERLVDRLLASPRYGERWGRFWLDVARYADNKGYVFFEEKTFPWAYTYRDYVVRAFNADLPFDRFVLEQLAADRLAPGKDQRALTAMGFLTLGGRFMNNTHDVIDDRIDVVTRGLMGVTVTCARCHDHKFDPIAQAEYYALYGVFRSSIEPVLPPTFRPAASTVAAKKFDAEMRKRLKALNDYVTTKRKALIADGRKRVAEYLLEAYAKRNQPATDDFMLLIPAGGLNPTMVNRWQRHLARAKRNGDPVWTIWHWYADIPDGEFEKQAPAIHKRIAKLNAKSNPLVVEAFRKRSPKSMKEVAATYARLLHSVTDSGMPSKHRDSLSRQMQGDTAPPVVPRMLGYGFLSLLPDRKAQGEYKKLLKSVEQWSIKGPAAPARAMVLRNARQRYQPRIFLRGNPSRPGKPVSRVLPRVVDRKSSVLADGSGRLQLARAVVDSRNPLTARVIVNRIWRHHFGAGLVTTPSDFGTRSQPPSHPRLLDWLASNLMTPQQVEKRGKKVGWAVPTSVFPKRSDLVSRGGHSPPYTSLGFGWSLKKLHRAILLSATYRQRSADRPACRAKDPTNRLLWRMNRRRLGFEAMRDSLLAASGSLDQRIGGKPVNLLAGGFQTRRTIYGFIDRMNLPNLHRAFDFPSPAATSPKRESTTIPPQALYFMNHAFVREAANRLVVSVKADRSSTAIGIGRLYQQLFTRRPSEDELRLAQRYLGASPGVVRWRRYAQALLLTNEFVFVD